VFKKEIQVKNSASDLVRASNNEEIVQLQREAIYAYGRRLQRPLSLLEAGCGRKWLLDLSGLSYTLTGVDLDPEALKYRMTVTRDLDIGICGDLCSVELGEGSFDIIYSCYVLEHVQQADVALQNFAKWLKPGGLLILRLPERDTARGFVTRMTPHWFHIWYCRYVLGMKCAGEPGVGPFPTCFHPVIGRSRLTGFLRKLGVDVLSSYALSCGETETKRVAVREALRLTTKVISMFSLGRLDGDYTEITYLGAKSTVEMPNPHVGESSAPQLLHKQ
jgi:SAM-dependent methyltransferase